MNQDDFRKIMATPRPGDSSDIKPRSLKLPTPRRPPMTPNMRSDVLFKKPPQKSRMQGKANTQTFEYFKVVVTVRGFKSKTTVVMPEGYRDRAKERNTASSTEETSSATIGLDLDLVRRIKAGQVTTKEASGIEVNEPALEEELEQAFKPPPPKKSRDEILAELRKQRPKLGEYEGHVDTTRFQSIEAAREVEIQVTKKEKKEKKKLEEVKKPLDIFDDVEADYDPFADIDHDYETDTKQEKKGSYFNQPTIDEYGINAPSKEELLAAVQKASKLQQEQEQKQQQKQANMFSEDAYEIDVYSDEEEFVRKKRRRGNQKQK